MRVFLVVWWFDTLGGMERHVTALGCALAGRGHDVTVFTEMPLPRANTYGRQLRAAGIPVIGPRAIVPRDTHADAPEVLCEVLARGDYNRRTRSLFRSLDAARRAATPDVVHVHGCRLGQQWVAEWAAACAIPVAYTEHTTLGDWGGPHDADAPFAILASAGALACVSEHSRRSLLAVLPAPREIRIARHIIPVPQAIAPSSGFALCVARLAPHKGIDVLLDAIGLLHRQGVRVPLQIAGDGESRAALEAQARRQGIDSFVTFLGQVAAERVSSLWAGALFGVLPSRTEGLPLSIVEAMSHGRAVIASQVGGIPELITDSETGVLVPSGDAPALAFAIRRFAEDPALPQRLGASARRAFDRGGWSEAAVVEETLAMYAAARAYRYPSFDPGPARDEARLAAAPWSPVYHVVYGLAALGDGEQEIADLALALRWAGAEVGLVLDSRVSPYNRYVRRLRRAGVPVRAPLFAGSVRGVLEKTCHAKSPAAIHLHYWSTAKPWAARGAVRAFAETRQITYAETDHASSTPPAAPEDPHARLAWLSAGGRSLRLVRDAVALYERSCHAHG